MMKQFQFIPIDLQLFEESIYSIIKKEIATLKKDFQPKEPEEYLTRQEVAEIFKMDISSVHNYRKRGILTAYQIGGRVLFKRSEIEAAMVKLKISRL